MSDKKLLDLAAKAIGISLVWSSEESLSPRIRGGMKSWNPLADDGDALRLAVMLRLTVVPPVIDAAIIKDTNQRPLLTEVSDGDPFAATRRAIVRAAAALGEQS